MNKLSNLIIKLVVGFVVICFLLETLKPGGALGNLTGMLISKYPFHEPVLEVFRDSLGWNISFVPEVKTSVLDDILILLLAALISSGIANVLKNIFNPVDMRERGAEEYMQSVGYRLKGVMVSVLSSVVTILISNMIFTSIIQNVNDSMIGGIVFTLVKIVVLVITVSLFVVFTKAVVDVGTGKGFGFGLFAFFAIGSIFRTVMVDVVSVYILAGLVNSIH